MALDDMTKIKADLNVTEDALMRLERTSFAREGIQERGHLQAALRDHIELIDNNLHVIAEGVRRLRGRQSPYRPPVPRQGTSSTPSTLDACV